MQTIAHQIQKTAQHNKKWLGIINNGFSQMISWMYVNWNLRLTDYYLDQHELSAGGSDSEPIIKITS